MNELKTNNQLITIKVVIDLFDIPDLFFLIPIIIPEMIPAYIKMLKKFPVLLLKSN